MTATLTPREARQAARDAASTVLRNLQPGASITLTLSEDLTVAITRLSTGRTSIQCTATGWYLSPGLNGAHWYDRSQILSLPLGMTEDVHISFINGWDDLADAHDALVASI